MHDVAVRKRDPHAVGGVDFRDVAEPVAKQFDHPRAGVLLRGPGDRRQPGPADLGRKRLEAVAAGEAPGQRGDQAGHRHALLPAHHQHRENDDQRVARRQRRQGATFQANAVRLQEAAVGLVPHDAAPAGRPRLFHPGDHVGGADAGSPDLAEQTRQLDGAVAADRRHHHVRLQEAGAQHPGDIPAQPLAVFVADQRAVAVAVGRHDAVEPVLQGPALRQFHVLRANRLRVHGHEAVRPPERDHFGAQPLQDFSQQVPAHAGVLVDADAHSGKAIAVEEIEVAAAVQCPGGRVHRRQFHRLEEFAGLVAEPLRKRHALIADGRFVRLEDLALGLVELDAVAVVRYVAAGHHDRGDTFGDSVERHRGGRQETAVDTPEPPVFDRPEAGRHDARRARAQVPPDRHPGAGGDEACLLQVLQEGARVEVADLVGHGLDEPPRPAGPEAHAGTGHQFRDRDAHADGGPLRPYLSSKRTMSSSPR